MDREIEKALHHRKALLNLLTLMGTVRHSASGRTTNESRLRVTD